MNKSKKAIASLFVIRTDLSVLNITAK